MASNTSIIEYLPPMNPKYVRKTLKKNKPKYLLKREVEALKILSESGRTPTVIEVTDISITMDYVGEKISLDNLPLDWEEQVENILEKLEEKNVSHNDIQSEEILVLNNKLYLIDFQHWTSGREEFENLIMEKTDPWVNSLLTLKESDPRRRLLFHTDRESLYYIIKRIQKS